jgi:ABC-2 type transport system ATP-binding protein
MTLARTALRIAAAGLLVTTVLVAPARAAEPVVTNGCVDSVPEPGSSTPVKICYTLFKPAGASSTATVPMVLHSHGWGGSRTRTAASFSAWLDAGFGVLSFDQRAHGESTGVAHVMNPDFEGQDVVRIVDLVGSLDWVTKQRQGDLVLGSIGGSYGGGYQLAGAFTELRDRGRTRFDALAPEITWYDLKDSLAPQEVPRAVWLSILFAAGGSKLPPAVQQAFLTAIVGGGWPPGQAGADLTAFFAENGPAWHVANGRRLDIPVLFGQGVTDNLFNLNQGLKNFDRALTPRARTRSMLVGYNGGHTLPAVLPPGFGTPGDPCSVALGSPNFADLELRFMKLNLKHVDTGLTGFGQYHLSTADARCVTQRTLAANTRYRLAPIVTTSGAGLPFAVKVASGPVKLAGPVGLDARVSSLVPDSRAFFALSVGTSPVDAKIVQNNTMPWREATVVAGAERSIELPAVAVDVPAGKSLFLTVSPVADMYTGQGSRPPGVLRLDDVRLTVHRTYPMP